MSAVSGLAEVYVMKKLHKEKMMMKNQIELSVDDDRLKSTHHQQIKDKSCCFSFFNSKKVYSKTTTIASEHS